MKKIVSLLIILTFVCAAVSSCSKEPEFIKLDAEKITGAFWTTGNKKNIDSPEYYNMIAEAYNSVTEVRSAEGNDSTARWTIAVTVENDGKGALFTISFIDQDAFKVRVNGDALTGGEDVEYIVVNKRLKDLALGELTEIRELSENVTIKFTDSDGKTLAECSRALLIKEDEIPSVMTCAADALKNGDVKEDYELDEAGRVISFKDMAESHEPTENGVTSQTWKYFLNGEAIDYSAASSTYVKDGDVIELVFTTTSTEN